ncbi:hypothetical protein V4762_00335 [Thermodesulfobium sp. 4217-1]|uniref:hypothetical protein n=1 Tax=Thermodesulfobium sp. 4217-1 TaxID=3120013 RepID=UPI003221AF21
MYFFKNKRNFLIIVVVLLMAGLFLYRTFGTHRTNSYQNNSNYSENSNSSSYPKNSYNNYNDSYSDSFKNIEVSGAIYNLKFRTSKRGNEYTTFKVKTEDNKIYNCYSPKWLSIKNNEVLKVSGKYFETKHVGRYTFYNEIDVENFSSIK